MTESLPDEELRERVLELAGNLFGDLGYDATDMRMIADAAGLPASRLTALVGDKRSLYLNVFRRRWESQQEALAGPMSSFTPNSLGIRRISDAYLDWCLAHPQYVGMVMHRWQGDAADLDLDLESTFNVPVLSALDELVSPAVRPGLDLEVAIWNVVWCVNGFVRFGLLGADGRLHGSDNPVTIRRFRAYLHDMIARTF